MISFFSCDMLSRDSSAEGFGCGAGQEIQEGCDARHRGWSQRRFNDQK